MGATVATDSKDLLALRALRAPPVLRVSLGHSGLRVPMESLDR